MAGAAEPGPWAGPLLVLVDRVSATRFTETWLAAAAYFARVTNGRIGHDDWLAKGHLVSIDAAPEVWGSGVDHGGMGRPPNSRTVVRAVVEEADRLGLLAGVRSARLIVVAPAGTGYRPHAWRLRHGGYQLPGPQGRCSRLDRYVIVDADVGIGALAHEMGHLIFDWPDHHRSGCGSNCLMATGGLAPKPAWPCAPLRVEAGWQLPERATFDSTRRDLADGVVLAHRDLLIEAGSAHMVVVHRRGRRPFKAQVELDQSLIAVAVRLIADAA